MEECQDKRHVSFTLHMDAGQNDIHEFQYCTAQPLYQSFFFSCALTAPINNQFICEEPDVSQSLVSQSLKKAETHTCIIRAMSPRTLLPNPAKLRNDPIDMASPLPQRWRRGEGQVICLC